MYLHIAEPKSADIFIGRMRETEKMAIRMASNPDALEYLRTVEFAVDMLTPEVMTEVKTRLDAEFKAAGQKKGFGQTWKI